MQINGPFNAISAARARDLLGVTTELTKLRSSVTVTPFDFIPVELHDAIRSGVNAPAVDTYVQLMITTTLAKAGNVGVQFRFPAGEWRYDRCVELLAFTAAGSANRKINFHFEEGAKLVSTDANTYRFVALGAWDAATNPTKITSGSGVQGDAWVAVSAHDSLNIDGITNANVGDTFYRNATKWQKILAKPRYKPQFWDASTNLDGSARLVILPLQGEEGDTVIVGKGGTSNIDGSGRRWGLGEEAYFTCGGWRPKTVRGGTFRGYWDYTTNTVYTTEEGSTVAIASPALTNAKGTAGDWFIVRGPLGGFTLHPITLDGTHSTGLGEQALYIVGDKIACIAPGRYRKIYASPTPRGTWEPATDQYLTQWHPGTTPAGAAAGPVGPVVQYTPLAGQGAYGDLFEITQPGTSGAIGSLPGRSWQRGEFLYRGPNGFEVIAQDPNWDRGIFRFWQDDRTVVYVSGTVHFVSRRAPYHPSFPTAKEYSAGWCARSYSLARPNRINYLFQNNMLVIDRLLVESDNADAAASQFYSGDWEGVWETKNLYLPRINKAALRCHQLDGATRMAHAFTYPRLAAYGVRHVDGYATWTTDFGYNGAFGTAYSVESAVWDPEQTSYEGGFLAVNGAGCLDMVNISHGLRGMPSDYEPTFKIVSGDTNFSRYGIRISGHTGVEIDGGAPILPGPGGSVPAITKPAFIFIDGANLVVIRNTIPHAGTYKSADEYSALIKTTGVVGNVIVDGLNIAQLGQGYIFDVGHNANMGRVGFQPTDDFLRVGNFSGYVRDTAAIKLMAGGTDRITGAVDVFTPTIISEASTPYNPTFGGLGGLPS